MDLSIYSARIIDIMSNSHLQTSFIPSYAEYQSILKCILAEGKLMDFTEVTENTSEFILLRHDVEFSVERAWKLSLIETKFGVNASYFVQVTNNTYNVLSKRHLDMLIDMEKRGHHIGLHYHVNGGTNIKRI